MINPKLQYCSVCGEYSFTPTLLQKIHMLLFGSYHKICPVCGARMEFQLMNHVVKIDTTDYTRDKMVVWKNG